MRNLVTHVFCLMGCLALAACGNAGSQQLEASASATSSPLPQVDRSAYSHITATFNSELQTVSTPLDAYVHTEDELAIIATANYYPLKDCVLNKGQNIPHHHYQVEYKSYAPYGVWSPVHAEKYGYSLHKSLGKVYLDDGYQGQETPEMSQALAECVQETADQEIPVLIKGVAVSGGSIISEISGQSQALLQADPDVQAAINEWKTCLAEAGISMDPQYEQPIPLIPEDTEANIQQALIDVQCKQKVRLMERYYNAQAQYEQALIEKNQAALNTIAQQKEAYLDQARQQLRQRGISL